MNLSFSRNDTEERENPYIPMEGEFKIDKTMNLDSGDKPSN